jgi:hypothetical protein
MSVTNKVGLLHVGLIGDGCRLIGNRHIWCPLPLIFFVTGHIGLLLMLCDLFDIFRWCLPQISVISCVYTANKLPCCITWLLTNICHFLWLYCKETSFFNITRCTFSNFSVLQSVVKVYMHWSSLFLPSCVGVSSCVLTFQITETIWTNKSYPP